MAIYTKVKNLSNVGFTGELTTSNVYNLITESETTYTVVDDLLVQATYSKTLFTPYYEVPKLAYLLPSTGLSNGAYGTNNFGQKYKVVSADSNYIRLNSIENSDNLTVTILVPFVDSFGGVASALSTLTHYGLAINYVQDVAKTFSDRDLLVSYLKTVNINYNENTDGIVTLTNKTTGATVIPNLVGLSITLS